MNAPRSEKVIVGLSGGVDFGVRGKFMLKQGYQVEAMFMKNWDEDDGTEYCTARTDLEDAFRICDLLNIELHTVNFAAEYWNNVFAHFLTEYQAGRTPNPDVLCNRVDLQDRLARIEFWRLVAIAVVKHNPPP